MEKILSQEERIRRAEELYNKRRYIDGYRKSRIYDNTNKINNNRNKITFKKKTIYQIILCLIIYLVLYEIKISDFTFKKYLNDQIKEALSYEINFNEKFEYIKDFFKANDKLSFLGLINNNNQEQESKDLESNLKENENDIKEEENVEEEVKQTNISSIEENDAQYIKNNFNIIWPLNGTITSKFGARTPTDIVSANHKGLDIGGNTGDIIVAGMDGKVTLVSEEGDYGKHIEITNNDVLTLYAHCSKLLVSEGQEIKKGEAIAEVGQTGKATGSHLHFEIRRNNVAIDPELVL